jgi:hypothetical protein
MGYDKLQPIVVGAAVILLLVACGTPQPTLTPTPPPPTPTLTSTSCAGRKCTSVRRPAAQDEQPLWVIRADQLIPERTAFSARTAERIRGELLKLNIEVSKRTIQKYMPKVRRQSGQTWATFLKNHAGDIWACDFAKCCSHCTSYRPDLVSQSLTSLWI